MAAGEADRAGKDPGSPTPEEVSSGLSALGRRRSFGVGMVVGLIAAIAAVLLVVQNGQSVRVEWLWFDLDLPQWLLLTGTLAIGAFVGQIGRLAAIRGRAKAAERRELFRSARGRRRGR